MLRKALPLTVASVVLASISAFAADSKPANAPAAKPPKKEGTKWDLMDHGPFLSSYMDTTPKVNKAVSIDLGNGATVCFDTEMCKLALGWSGGFVRLPSGRDGLEGMPKPAGSNIVFTTPNGPGWADASGAFVDGRPEFRNRKYGPLPREHAKWKGIHLSGQDTVLEYTVGKGTVFEKHAFDVASGMFTRILDVDPNGSDLTALICDAKAKPTIEGSLATITDGEKTTLVSVLGSGTLEYGTNKAVLLKFGTKPGLAVVRIWRGPTDQANQLAMGVQNGLHAMPGALAGSVKRKPAQARWGEPLLVPGKVSTNKNAAYVVDTISVPETNRFNSWIRCSGLDFFSDATRAAVCSVSGDVWLLSNIDEKLDRVTWKRFATGLFQPLGLRIV